jgi:hypothetical protein
MQRRPFNVNEFRAQRQGVHQDSMALFLGPGEEAAFPLGPARHDNRLSAVAKGARDIQIGHAVQTHLDHVGHGGIARGYEVGHRTARHGFAQKRTGHKNKNASPT